MSGIEVEVISHVVEVAPGFGPAGPTGPGVPVGGATGQVLAKASATNFDTQWVDPEAAAAGDHGALSGLANDDHPQYHNDARGDARYAPLAHDHDADYEAIGAAAGAVSAHAAAPSAHPISGVDGLAAALALLAPLASPALTGTPTAPTALAGTASTQLATTAFVAAAIAALLNSAPGALDTLDELAAALGDDPNFAASVTNALAGKLAKASNLSDLTDAAAARTNLGAGAVGAAVFQAATAAAIRTLLELGGAAVLSVGATAGTVAAGDDARLSDARTPTSHTHALGDITQSGATSGQIATWNGTAWVPQTPSGASPGGSGSELQYRGGASTFGGAAGTHWDAVNGRLSIGAGTSPAGMLHAKASAASVIPAVLEGAASQTANVQEWRSSAGAALASVTSAGVLFAAGYQFVGTTAGWTSVTGNNFGLTLRAYNQNIVSVTGSGANPSVSLATACALLWSTDLALSRAAAGILLLSNGSAGAALEMAEQTAPSAPGSNKVRIYAEDNGSGKTRLMALFPTGAAQQIAIEP